MRLSQAYDLASGDALFFSGKLPHSKVIEAYTHSQYSHVALVAGGLPFGGCEAHCNRIMIVESLEPGGVRTYPLAQYLRECQATNCRVDWYKLKTERRDRLKTRAKVICGAIDQVGKDYALGQVVYSFSKITSWLRSTLRLPVNIEKNKWFCSELAADRYAQAGFKIPKVPALMSPQDVSELDFLEFCAFLEPDPEPLALAA